MMPSLKTLSFSLGGAGWGDDRDLVLFMSAQNAGYFTEYALDKVEVTLLMIFFLSLHLNISHL